MIALEQARAFAAMAACGVISGAIYDAGMLFRRMTGAGRLAAAVMDILFAVWLSAAVTLAALQLRIDPFRLYVLLGVGAGMALWFATVGYGLRTLLDFAGKRRQCVKKRAAADEEVEIAGRK